MAREIIKENHPLNDTPIWKVFPVFKLCRRGPSKKEEKKFLLDDENFKPRDRRASSFRKKGQAEIPEDADEDTDPFNFLGFGMVAYRDLMLVLILLFTVISILMIPAM